jgi:hypothetical protein
MDLISQFSLRASNPSLQFVLSELDLSHKSLQIPYSLSITIWVLHECIKSNFASSFHVPLVNDESLLFTAHVRIQEVQCVSIVFCHDASIVHDVPTVLVSLLKNASHWESVSVESAVPVLVHVSEHQLISVTCAQVSQSLRRPADIRNVSMIQIQSNEDWPCSATFDDIGIEGLCLVRQGLSTSLSELMVVSACTWWLCICVLYPSLCEVLFFKYRLLIGAYVLPRLYSPMCVLIITFSTLRSCSVCNWLFATLWSARW